MCCIDAFSTLFLRCPSDIDPFQTGSRVDCADTLIFMATPPRFSAPTVKTETSSAEAGEHNREALCFGNCCNTKYSPESAIAAARLICPSREDYQARPWQCPAEPRLTLACALTPLLNSSSSALDGKCFWSISALHSILALVPINEFASSPQPSEVLYLAHIVRTLKVMRRCCGIPPPPFASPHGHPLVSPQTQHPL